MPAHVRGETTLEVDGEVYKVRFTWDALERVETELGTSVGQLVFDLNQVGVNARTCLSIARAGLAEHHPDLTPKQVSRLFDRLGKKGKDELLRLARTGLEYAFPDAEEPSEADPTKPPSKS